MNLLTWFSTPLGARALKAERRFVHRLLSVCVRNAVLQLGGPLDNQFLTMEAHLPLRTYFANTAPAFSIPGAYFSVDFNALPIQTATIDLVLALHVLETSSDPKVMLLQLQRILKPEGVLVITGLHRYSLWRMLLPKRYFPRNTHYYSMITLTTLLNEMGFQVNREQTACFRLPFQKKPWLFLEMLGHLLLPFLGGVYMITAVKKTEAMTPFFEKLMLKSCA